MNLTFQALRACVQLKPFVYKFITGQEATYEDLQDNEPQIAESLDAVRPPLHLPIALLVSACAYFDGRDRFRF